MKGAAKCFLVSGALFGLLSVLAGAGGAHVLLPILAATAGEARFVLATEYLFIHALTLLILSLLVDRFPKRRFELAGWLIVIGTLLFCGSLFLRTFINTGSIITPVGGGILILGWMVLLLGALGNVKRS